MRENRTREAAGKRRGFIQPVPLELCEPSAARRLSAFHSREKLTQMLLIIIKSRALVPTSARRAGERTLRSDSRSRTISKPDGTLFRAESRGVGSAKFPTRNEPNSVALPIDQTPPLLDRDNELW